MRIGLRILLGYFLIVGLAAWFLLNVFMEQVKPGVRSTLEDTLVDTSQLLANLVAPDLRAGTLATSPVLARMQDYARHGVDININGVRKRPSITAFILRTGVASCCSIPAGATWGATIRAGTTCT
jgi:two-component system sensor histidine kinase CreC